MDVTTAVFQITAVLYIACGLGFLLNRSYYQETLPRLMDMPGVLLAFGFMSVVLGMLVLQGHSTWSMEWDVLVTIIGWAAVIKGVVMFVFPGHFRAKFRMYESPKVIGTVGPLALLIGLALAYLGFFS